MKMRHLSSIFAALPLLAALFLLPSCDVSLDPVELEPARPLSLSTKQQAYVAGGNSFAFHFLDRMEAEAGKDYVISPLSMQFLLGMLLDGAKGETAAQICSTLGYGSGETELVDEYCRSMLSQLPNMDKRTRLELANAIFVDEGYPLTDAYMSSVRKYYDAEVANLDFADIHGSANKINKWCSDHTEGLVPKILDETDPDMLAYLLNALYFKSQWRHSFNPASTVAESFTHADGSTSKLKMMKQYETFDYTETESFQAVSLPYGNGAFLMTVLLPKGKEGTSAVTAYFRKTSWDNFRYSMYPCSVDLWLPRFETSFGMKLNDLLSAMGMPLAFDPKADFSAMSAYALCLSFVRQDAVIKVDEEGTEAAAISSAAMMKNTSVGSDAPPVIFHANRPFVYLISESSSGAILFAGRFSGK